MRISVGPKMPCESSKARQGISGQIALARQQQKRYQHRDRRLPVQQPGAAQPAHQRHRSEDVHHVIHIESIARTLLPAHARQGSIQAVAQPVERHAHNHQQQRVAVVARQRIADARANLRAKPKQRELVRGHPARRALGHPLQGALLHATPSAPGSPAAPLQNPMHRFIAADCRIHRRPPFRQYASSRQSDCLCRSQFLRSALHVERNVNSSDSRGTLSTNGPIAQPSPRRNRARQRDRLDLHVESAVPLLVAPVGIQPPQKAVLLAGSQRALVRACPATSISEIRVLREMLYPCCASSRPKVTS